MLQPGGRSLQDSDGLPQALHPVGPALDHAAHPQRLPEGARSAPTPSEAEFFLWSDGTLAMDWEYLITVADKS
ncbi:hypothetical protein GCM10027447_27470 [Glycomyces halotolerans]